MKNLTTYLNRKGLPTTFVLYSSKEATIDALNRDEVDVTWNSPDTHAKFHILSGGSQALAMRDVDQGRLTMVVRTDAGIKSLQDLPGKRLILGHVSYQTGAPVHFLKKAGVDLDLVTLVPLKRVDRTGASILQALTEDRADAAVILESQWKRTKASRGSDPAFQTVWNSQEICHCTFTAAKDFDLTLGNHFTRLITTMDSKDPLVAELNRLEHAKEWVSGNPDGFEALIKTLKTSGLKKRKQAKPRSKDVVRIAGHAYSPNDVTKFQNLKTYFNRKGFPLDFVLYADHHAQVDALERGEVDIMFSSPIPHATYHLRVGASQTLAMRDVDKDLRVTLVARAASNIESLSDLRGKRLILGSKWNAEGALHPVYYLKKEGVDIDQLNLVILPERDSAGKRANTAQHVLKALSERRGDAAVVLERVWTSATVYRDANPNVKQVWTSPEFCHCTVTAPPTFDAKLGQEFTRIMTNMDPKDPLVAELNRLTHSKSWVEGDSAGFEALYEALQNKAELLKGAKK
jgi:ABC-type phosphate/phosphonate transport system substrate-binding protein